MNNTITITSLAKDSFSIGKQNYIPMLLNCFFYATAMLLLMKSIIGIIFTPAVICGLVLYSLKCARGEKLDIPDSFVEGFKNNRWWKMAVFSIVWYIAIVIATILLIVPGIYLLVISVYAFYFIVEEPDDSKNAFKKSKALVKGVGWWKTFACLIVLSLFLYVPGIILMSVFGIDYILENEFGFQIVNLFVNSLIAPFIVSYLPLLYIRSKHTQTPLHETHAEI